MDASAAKRRKTSPTASVPVPDESTTPPGLPPLESQSQQARQQSAEPSASRQSAQPHSSSSPSQRASGAAAARRREASASQRSDSLPASQPSSRGHDAASSAREAHSDPARRRLGSRSSRSPSTAATATAPTPPPQPRPLPPPGPEIEDDIANPSVRRSSRLSPTGTADAALQAPEEEPELPPTPQRPDPVVSTPPSGIHNTPSKRRRDAGDRQTVQQPQPQPQPQALGSPSKRTLSKEVALRQLSPRKEPPRARSPQKGLASGGASHSKEALVSANSPAKEATAEAPPTKPPSAFTAGTNPRRSVRLRGADWEKQQERHALLRELEQLEKDVDLARREIDNAASGASTAADKDALLDLLTRSVLPAAKDAEPEPGADWLDAAMNPMAILGFNGSSSVKLPPVIPLSTFSKEELNPPPPKSHHPLPMTATEELPFLQVFTPLKYTSTMTVLPPPPSSPQTDNDQQQQQQQKHPDQQPLLQKQFITIRSANPPGLFTAHMEMTTNTRTLAVAALAVPRLDPAAAPELAPFLERASASSSAAQAPYHPALTRNPNIICWAMAEWYRVALKRAKFWHVLDTQLGQSAQAKSGLVEVVLAMRARKKRKRRQREAAIEGEGAEQQDSDVDGLDTLDAMKASKRDLLPHMGRTSMDITVPYLPADASEKEDGQAAVSELRVDWTMEFDWTGEASSKLGVQVGVPIKWQAVDTRKSIVGIPKLFDRLLQGGEDPLVAVKTVVALLAGEP